MPIQYKDGIVKEHISTRTHAGFFDVSHMGQFFLEGDQTLTEALEKIIPADLQSLKEMRERLIEYDNNGIGLVEGFAYIPGLLRGGQIEAITAGVATHQAKVLASTAIGFLFPDGPLMFAGEAVGAKVGNIIGLFTGLNAYANKMTLDMAQIESGHQYLDARDAGFNVRNAQIVATGTGIANAALERVGIEYFSRVLKKNTPGALKILSPLASPLLKKSGLDKAINLSLIHI